MAFSPTQKLQYESQIIIQKKNGTKYNYFQWIYITMTNIRLIRSYFMLPTIFISTDAVMSCYTLFSIALFRIWQFVKFSKRCSQNKINIVQIALSTYSL